MQKKCLYQEIVYWVLIVLLLVAGGFMLFFNLDGEEIHDCDEARHGINAYEMMQSGDYVVTTYDGEPDYWNLKPPLTDYCIILGYRIFGYNATGLRFYSALSMMITMIVLALWTKRRYGSVASIGTMMFLLGCGFIYGHHFARRGDADAQLVMFYVIAMLCMLQSQRNIRWLYGSALCFGLAFMSKSWHAALIPVTCFVYLLVTGQLPKLKVRHYLMLIVLGLLPIAPWAVARIQRDGWTFFEKMFTVDVVTRATTVHEVHFGGPLFYVQFLLNDRVTVIAMAACLGAVVWKAVRRTPVTKDQWGVALWFLVPLVLYTACVSKLHWYIFVSLPALAVGFGLCCRLLCKGLRRLNVFSVLRAAVLVAMLVVAGMKGIEIWGNVHTMGSADRYQRLLWENFDRETAPGTHIYVQYESENSYYPVDYRSWVMDDKLTAMLAGDLVCMNGGIDAFCEEEEPAYLICHNTGMEWEILGDYPVLYQDGPLMLVENLN